MRAAVSKKQRVGLIDLNHLDDLKGLSHWKALALPPAQAAPTPSSSKQDIRSASVALASQALMPDSCRPNPPQPPKITPGVITKPGNLPVDMIDLCSSEDEGPMDNDRSSEGRYSQTEAHGLENVGRHTEEESDSDYWSTCISDEDREEPCQVLYPVGKAQPTHIQKGWIPPVSSFTTALYEFPINVVYLDFHRTPSPS